MSIKSISTQLPTALCILVSLFFLGVVPQALYAQVTPPTVTYLEGSNTIIVGSTVGTAASQPITFAELVTRVARADVLSKQGDAWLLQANIVVEATAQLSIAPADGVTKLHLESRFGKFVYILARQGGHLNFDGMIVTSWDTTTQQVDQEQATDERAYILAQDGARMDIRNSEFAYLGSQPGGNRASGVAWLKRLSPADPATGPTGVVENSKFHHNYQGLYVSEGYNLKITNNEIHSNLFHGAFLRDGTQGSEINANTVHSNVAITFMTTPPCIPMAAVGLRWSVVRATTSSPAIPSIKISMGF
jgi:parallel beta-helix repeat protein